MSTTPSTPTTEELRAAAVAAEVKPPETPVAPPPPDPNDPYTLTEGENGQVEVKLRTGEVFKGTAMDVAKAIAKSKVDTTDYSRELKTELTALKEQTAHISQALTPKPPAPTQEELDQKQLQEFLANQQAQYLGFPTADAMRQQFQSINQTSEQARSDRIAMDFMAECPEFPATKENSDKLLQTAVDYGIVAIDDKGQLVREPSAKQLIAAHALSVQLGVYKPLTEAEIQAQINAGMKIKPKMQARPVPPPMTPGTQPENVPGAQAPDLWNEPLDQMKARLIREQRAQMGR